MPEQPDAEHRPPEPAPPVVTGGSGLRVRLWFGCLLGALVAAGGIWWVIGMHTGPDVSVDLAMLVTWLASVAAIGVLAGAAAALWLDRAIVGHLRGLNDGIAAGQVAGLRGLPAASGWGDLSELTQRIQNLISQHRQMARAAEELGLARTQLGQMREALERWNETERWSGLWAESGPVAPVAESLNAGLRRLDEVREQNLEVVRQIADEVEKALLDARETSEQAEAGFVEATSLLTTVRELQRLESVLAGALAAFPSGPAEPAASALAAFRDEARGAVTELVDSSLTGMEQVAGSLSRVQEIAGLVRVLGNRSTLIALQAAVASVEGGTEEIATDLRRLASDVQEATARTETLCRELERDAAAALGNARAARERVASRMAALPDPAARAPAPIRGGEDALRLAERMREMIHDAARKSERLSSAGERVSRSAERLVRGIEEETSELAGLAARLDPPEPGAPSSTQSAEGAAPDDAPRTGGLRLLDHPTALPEADTGTGAAREEQP
jgi:methyl-accepting chemotaxis protein